MVRRTVTAAGSIYSSLFLLEISPDLFGNCRRVRVSIHYRKRSEVAFDRSEQATMRDTG